MTFRHDRYKVVNCGVKTAALYWLLTVAGQKRREETAKLLRSIVGPEKLRKTVQCETSLLGLLIMLF